jgi:mycothiol synthase
MPLHHLEPDPGITQAQWEARLDALLAEVDAAPAEVDAAEPAALVIDAEPVSSALADAAATRGFELVRTTLQLRRPLPLDPPAPGDPPPPPTRAFVVGRDEDEWLAVNNRAFAWHPDQANRTLEDLAVLEAEDWFRADGFLVHPVDPDEPLDGFCWTKIHAHHQPPLGEIYVIGVDPDHHGHGLGRALVRAGLDWLADHGLTTAMLYVEADNQAARHLYESLGFVEHQAHRWWSRPLPPR